METRSDNELMELVARGDTMAFKLLYERYEMPIFNLILRSTGNREIAQDLLQETFVRLWQVANVFDPRRGVFKGWLFRIALNITRSEMAKKQHHVYFLPVDEALPGYPAAIGPDKMLEQHQQKNRVAQALGRLSPRLREVIILKYYHQLKFREIAEITDTPEGTLKARFHRAVAQLQGFFQARDTNP
jgi:RNA polymerase sigma-70 factor (ECF subfamily)